MMTEAYSSQVISKAVGACIRDSSANSLDENAIARHIRPLFKRSLELGGNGIYLANHSLGRCLDQTASDVDEGLCYWYQDPDSAWNHWLLEMQAFRERVGTLINAASPDCIVPKTSAGQGLRAILNCYDQPIRVITSSDEFNSIDHILKSYANKGRLHLQRIKPRTGKIYQVTDFAQALKMGGDLLIVSMVMFSTGQLFTDLPELIREAQKRGIKTLIDLYHAAGAVPVNVIDLNIDFAIGGSYKYLRGGPGACWLYLNPRHLDGSMQTLDTGWFAQSDPFAFTRPDRLQLAENGDRFLESTPAILPFYQARAGLVFTLEMGVGRLRSYSRQQLILIEKLLCQHNIPFLVRAEQRGAFIAIPHRRAQTIVDRLKQAGVTCDAREGLLRFGPDLLNTEAELITAVNRLVGVWKTV